MLSMFHQVPMLPSPAQVLMSTLQLWTSFQRSTLKASHTPDSTLTLVASSPSTPTLLQRRRCWCWRDRSTRASSATTTSCMLPPCRLGTSQSSQREPNISSSMLGTKPPSHLILSPHKAQDSSSRQTKCLRPVFRVRFWRSRSASTRRQWRAFGAPFLATGARTCCKIVLSPVH